MKKYIITILTFCLLAVPVIAADDVANDPDLSTNLISYWEMEEVSGARVDSTASGYDLTDNNTVTQNTGLQGNAAQFTRSTSEYLSVSDANGANLDVGGDITIAAAIYVDSLPGTNGENMQIVTKKSGDGGDVAYDFKVDTSNNLNFNYQGTGGTTLSDTDAAQITAVDTWYCVAVTVDVSAAQIIFYVNGSAVADTNVLSSATNMKTVADGNFNVGADAVNNRYYFDGRIDELGVWNKIATATEISELCNSGAYIPYEVPNSCTYSGTGDWNVLAKDNCYVNTDTYVQGKCALLNTEGPGALHIIDGARLACHGLESTSTPIHAESGTFIDLDNQG